MLEGTIKDSRFDKIVKAITELAKGWKGVAFYPENHPTLKQILLKICDIFEKIPSADDRIEISVSKLNLEHGGNKIPEKHEGITDLRKALFMRRTNTLIILKGVTPEDMKNFLEALSEDPDEVVKKGGLENVLIGRRVSKIWVNKVDYDKLMEEIKKEQEQDPKEADVIVFEDKPIELEDKITEDDIDSLLSTLAETTVSGQYRDLVLRISNNIKKMIRNERLHYAEKAIHIYSHHIENPQGRDEEIKEIAISGIKEVGDDSVIDLYVKKFSQKSLKERSEAHIVLLVLKEEAVNKILDALTDERNLIVRKAMVDLVIKMGHSSIPKIVKYLDDDRWYVIRNMITILGGMGTEDVASHIANTLQNPDPRVKKEAIKALSKNPSPISITALGECCFDPDENIVSISITALGAKKDEKAVKILKERFMMKRFIYPNYRISRDVIESLKNIGTENAIEVLRSIALYNPLIKPKRMKELKAYAVTAIGKIRTEKSRQALEKLSKSSDTICRNEASKMLKRLGYGEAGT